MPKLICLSIPHNGHHLVKNRILPDFPNMIGHEFYGSRHINDEDLLIWGHYHAYELHLWVRLVPQYQIIMPLRHPVRSMMSFIDRGKSYDEWNFHWASLMLLRGLYVNPLYLHVDNLEVRHREALLIREAAVVKGDYIDWSLGKDTNSEHGNAFIDIDKNILKTVPKRYIDFYEASLDKMKKMFAIEDYSKCA